MNIFITGSSGFLGSELKKKLEDSDFDLTYPSSRNCDLLLDQSLKNFTATRFDIIFHLAAWTQAGDFCLKHPGEQWINNQKINTNVINWWKEYQSTAKFVFMGTSCAYAPESNFKESEYLKGEPIESLYTYAMTKRMLLQGALSIEKQFGLKWLCLVPSTLYGENYHTDGRQMHFIFDLIRKIIRGKELGEKVELWGDGFQRREIIHVSDFVKRLLFLTKNFDNEIVNIGAGEDYSIREFAEIICDIVGYNANSIIYDTTKYTGSKQKKLSVEKLLSIYPEHTEQLISLKSGISSVINWFYKTKLYV